jgi:hypothetical protein
MGFDPVTHIRWLPGRSHPTTWPCDRARPERAPRPDRSHVSARSAMPAVRAEDGSSAFEPNVVQVIARRPQRVDERIPWRSPGIDVRVQLEAVKVGARLVLWVSVAPGHNE